MSVQLSINQGLTAKETIASASFPTISENNAAGSVVTHSAFNRSGPSLNGSSTPKVDAVCADELTTDGSDTIDLTSCKTVLDATTDMTGKRVVAFLFRCPDDNAAAMNIAPGGSNPYPLFGTGNDIDIRPGECIVVSHVGLTSPLPPVSGTVKNIDVTGTNGDVLQYEIVLGTP